MKNLNEENRIKFIAKTNNSQSTRKPESSVQRINSDDRSSLVNKIPLPFMYNTDKEVLEFKYVNDELKMQCPLCSKIFIKITNHIAKSKYCNSGINIDDFKTKLNNYHCEYKTQRHRELKKNNI